MPTETVGKFFVGSATVLWLSVLIVIVLAAAYSIDQCGVLDAPDAVAPWPVTTLLKYIWRKFIFFTHSKIPYHRARGGKNARSAKC